MTLDDMMAKLGEGVRIEEASPTARDRLLVRKSGDGTYEYSLIMTGEGDTVFIVLPFSKEIITARKEDGTRELVGENDVSRLIKIRDDGEIIELLSGILNISERPRRVEKGRIIESVCTMENGKIGVYRINGDRLEWVIEPIEAEALSSGDYDVWIVKIDHCRQDAIIVKDGKSSFLDLNRTYEDVKWLKGNVFCGRDKKRDVVILMRVTIDGVTAIDCPEWVIGVVCELAWRGSLRDSYVVAAKNSLRGIIQLEDDGAWNEAIPGEYASIIVDFAQDSCISAMHKDGIWHLFAWDDEGENLRRVKFNSAYSEIGRPDAQITKVRQATKVTGEKVWLLVRGGDEPVAEEFGSLEEARQAEANGLLHRF